MAHLYSKNTKGNTNFVETNLFFLKEIDKKMKLRNWTRESDNNISISLLTNKHPYCWDSINLIQKRLSDSKWECKMTHFLRSSTDGSCSYTWDFKKKKV